MDHEDKNLKIKYKFVQDDTACDIEVIIRAKERDKTVERIEKAIGGVSDFLVCNSLSDDEKIVTDEIVIISKDGRYLSVKTINGEYVLKEPLYQIEERLDKTQFVKISQSEIVNLKYVEGWSFDGGGIIKIRLAGGLSSYTSRRYATEIRKILKRRG